MIRSFTEQNVPRPKDFFPLLEEEGPQPVDLEIGCGVGFHSIRYALEHPERRLIAFERTSAKFDRFQRRLSRHPQCKNLLAIHGDAVAWITHGIPTASIDRIFILYPNPYPKARQHNLRWHRMPFFPFLISRLRQGGTLTLATNQKDYFAEAQESFSATCHLEVLEAKELSRDDAPRTHFEKKYLLRGDQCWNLVGRRSEGK